MKRIVTILVVCTLFICITACDSVEVNSNDSGNTSEKSVIESSSAASNMESINTQISSENSDIIDDYYSDDGYYLDDDYYSADDYYSNDDYYSDDDYTDNNSDTEEDSHIHNYSEADCTTPEKCSCGDILSPALGHSYAHGKCSVCGAEDSNYGEPVLVLGEYVKQNATSESEGVYTLSYGSSAELLKINWTPSEEKLVFESSHSTAADYLLARVTYNSTSNEQKIYIFYRYRTEYSLNFKATGYINKDTYSRSNYLINSFVCAPTTNYSMNRNFSESSIKNLMKLLENYLTKNTNLDLVDFGFNKW